MAADLFLLLASAVLAGVAGGLTSWVIAPPDKHAKTTRGKIARVLGGAGMGLLFAMLMYVVLLMLEKKELRLRSRTPAPGGHIDLKRVS